MRAKRWRQHDKYDDNEYNNNDTTEYDSGDTMIMITMNMTTAIQYNRTASWHGDTIDTAENDGDD
eukprot:CAMPEP_0172480778 /NCGR_PEP_ID=MMETSP1066-20121228/6212_1 /TAXON_ID=671091 /ORGANISM="Coscinodiscus wailesii, Strain CCMP2513" /LENGTH=64 /DNA_ID=CAMNT_0013242439 /DNA_START=181 /DNA_END=375 /DNA_ORIENTATION=-